MDSSSQVYSSQSDSVYYHSFTHQLNGQGDTEPDDSDSSLSEDANETVRKRKQTAEDARQSTPTPASVLKKTAGPGKKVLSLPPNSAEALRDNAYNYSTSISRDTSFGRAKLAAPNKTSSKSQKLTSKTDPTAPRQASKGLQRDMTITQQEVFELCRFKVFEILYQQNPYLSTKSLAIVLLKEWTLQAQQLGHTLLDCPFEPIPKKNLTKMYARVKSGLISDVAKRIPIYYDLRSKDSIIPVATLTSLLKNHAYLLPDPTANEAGQLRYYHDSPARIVAEFVIGKAGITMDNIRSWKSTKLLCFLFTVVHFAITKLMAPTKKTMIEEHVAGPIYRAHRTALTSLYDDEAMLGSVVEAFMENIERITHKPSFKDFGVPTFTLGDGMDAQKRKEAQKAYLAARRKNPPIDSEEEGGNATTRQESNPASEKTTTLAEPNQTGLTSSSQPRTPNQQLSTAADPRTPRMATPTPQNQEAKIITPLTARRSTTLAERFSPRKLTAPKTSGASIASILEKGVISGGVTKRQSIRCKVKPTNPPTLEATSTSEKSTAPEAAPPAKGKPRRGRPPKMSDLATAATSS